MILNKDEMINLKNTISGFFILRDDYTICSANEFFYGFVKDNSYHKLPELTHPDDRDDLNRALEVVSKSYEEQSVIIRLRYGESQYEVFYLRMKKQDKSVPESNYTIRCNFCSLSNIEFFTVRRDNNIRKYRRFMSMDGKYYFDYNSDTDMFAIYKYYYDRSVVILKSKLSEWYENTRKNLKFKDEIQGIDELYHSLTTCSSDFQLYVPESLFLNSHNRFLIKGSVIYNEIDNKLLVGILVPSEYNINTMNTSYFIKDMERDVTTGVFNKSSISEYIMHKISENPDGRFFFCIMDIDDFKLINDEYGHMFGDKVLISLADILKTAIKDRGVAGRFGGDEFVMVINDVDVEELKMILKVINKNFQFKYNNTNTQMNFSLSIGISEYPKDGKTYDEIFKIADKCLYIAKAKGKNRYIIYTPKLHGDISIEDNNKKLAKKLIVSNDDKADIVYDMISNYRLDRKEDFFNLLEDVRHLFDIDSIAIYSGADLMPYINIGINVDKDKSFIDIDKDGFLKSLSLTDNRQYITNIKIIEYDHPVVYKYMNSLNIFSNLVYFKQDDVTNNKVFLMFNVSRTTIKKSSVDLALINILGKLICDAVLAM